MSPDKHKSSATSHKVKVITALCLSLVLTITVQVFSFRLNNDLERTNQLVSHTYEVMNELDGINTTLTIMESDIRGYLVSNNQLFNKNFTTLKKRLQQHLAEAKKLVADNAGQLKKINELEPLINQKIIFSEQLIGLRQQRDSTIAINLVASGKGKNIMDQVRKKIAEAEQTERELLQQREVQSKALASKVSIINMVSTVLIVLILLVSGFIIITDVNKRSKLEQELRENESRIRQFLETIPVGISIVNTKGEIIYSNRQAHLILDYMPAQEYTSISALTGKRTIYRAGTDVLYPEEEMPLTKALKGQGTEVEDVEVRRGDKKTRLAVNACPVYDSSNKVIFAISAFSDITQRIKEAEELARAKEMAEQSVATKEIFMANMSHEIRTPMNAIIGFTNLLLGTETTKEQKEFIEIIRSSGENLLTIINDILDLSKIQAGMMEFEQIPFSIDPMMNSIKTLLQNKADEKNINLSFQADSKIPDLLVGDPTRLTQVLINLVNNAIKFTEKGFVSVNAALLKNENEKVWVRLSVSDSGVGIAEDKLEEIFERFNQATTATNRKYGGTGLGLSIVKTLVELQGGTVSVKSREGTGSTFTVDLPFHLAGEKELQEYTHEVHHTEKTHIHRQLHLLLVEDNALNQKLALRVLADMGFTTELAQNGKEAIDKIKSGTWFDVVLMDIQMPVVDGYEATRVIRNKLKNKIPIMAMTAHALSGEKEKCVAAGMNDYISKPFKPRELYDKIYQMAGLSQNGKTFAEQRHPVTNDTVCDLAYLRELSNGDMVFIGEMVALFYQQVPEEMENIRQAITHKHYPEVKAIAHKLKSSVLLVGAESMRDKLVMMEEWALNPVDEGAIEKLYDDLLQLRSRAFEELSAYVKK